MNTIDDDMTDVFAVASRRLSSEYFRNLLDWILKDNFSDEAKFPFFGKDDSFPENFRAIVADISRRLFRYARVD